MGGRKGHDIRFTNAVDVFAPSIHMLSGGHHPRELRQTARSRAFESTQAIANGHDFSIMYLLTADADSGPY